MIMTSRNHQLDSKRELTRQASVQTVIAPKLPSPIVEQREEQKTAIDKISQEMGATVQLVTDLDLFSDEIQAMFNRKSNKTVI